MEQIYGIVLWDQNNIKEVLFHEGLMLHTKDGTKYIGEARCPACIEDHSMHEHTYAVIGRDYGFKFRCHCVKCKQLIAGTYDKERKLYTPPANTE